MKRRQFFKWLTVVVSSLWIKPPVEEWYTGEVHGVMMFDHALTPEEVAILAEGEA